MLAACNINVVDSPCTMTQKYDVSVINKINVWMLLYKHLANVTHFIFNLIYLSTCCFYLSVSVLIGKVLDEISPIYNTQ